MGKKTKIIVAMVAFIMMFICGMTVFAASSPSINVTVDRWEKGNQNGIETEIIGKAAYEYQVGSAIPFRITMKIPENKYDKWGQKLRLRAIVTDTIPAGMTYNEDSLLVYLNGKVIQSTLYDIKVNDRKITVTLNGLNTSPYNAKENDSLVITFNAIAGKDVKFKSTNKASVQYDYGTFKRTLKSDEKIKYTIPICQWCGYRGKTQTECREHAYALQNWGHKTVQGLEYDYFVYQYTDSAFIADETLVEKSSTNKAYTYLFSLSFNNVDTNGKAVAGAEYTLYKKDSTNNWWEIKKISNTTQFTFTQLPSGTYKLVESKVPNNYQKVDDLEFTIKANSDTDGNLTSLKASGWQADLSTGVLSKNIVNNVKETSIKYLSARVEYKCGSVVKESQVISAQVQALESDTLSTSGIYAKAFVGWKLKNITINGKVVSSLPSYVNNGDTIVFNYIATEESTTTNLKATVEYRYNNIIKYSEIITKVVQNAGANVLSTSGISEKPETGYKLNAIKINGATRTSLPATVTDGSTIIYEYVTDKTQMKTLTAYVTYQSQDRIFEDKTLVKSVQYLERDEIDTNNLLKDYLGYRVDSIIINGITYYSLPSKISNNSTVIVNYVYDESQTRENIAYVYYELDNSIQDNDTMTIKNKVQYFDRDTSISTSDIIEKYYAGYELVNITINGKIVSELPDTVNNKDSIVFHYETEKIKVTTFYLDEDGVEIADKKVISNSYNYYYNTEQKDIEGYIFNYVTGNTNGYATENTTVIYNYKAKDANLIVKYMDKSGNILAPTKTITGKYWHEYKETPIIIEGYTCVGCSDNPTGIFNTDEKVIIFDYEESETPINVTVTTKYVDEDGLPLTNDIEITGNIGENYETERKTFTGYNFVSVDGNESGSFVNDTVITYHYQAIQTTIVINYQDENGKMIYPSTKITGSYNKHYETMPVEIDGYELIDNSGNTSGTYGLEDIHVIYTYRKVMISIHHSLTVYYLDDDGNELSSPTIETILSGSSYKTQPKEIKGYELIETPQNASGFLNEDIRVNYIYQKKEITIQVNYVDESGNELIASITVKSKYQNAYQFIAKDINGYKLLVAPNNASGNTPAEDFTIVFVYTLDNEQTKTINATVKYVLDGVEEETVIFSNTIHILSDENTIKTDDFVKYYKGYDIVTITINENVVNALPSNVSNNDIIILYYESVDAQVIVSYVDEFGHDIISKDILNGKYGDNYQTLPREIKGYILVNTPSNANGVMNNNIDVIYEYQKIHSSVTVKYIDENMNDIVPPDVLNGEYGDKYQTYAKVFDDYRLISADNIAGTFGEEDSQIIYAYEKKNAVVFIKYIDENNKEVYQTQTLLGKYGDSYHAEAVDIYGYELIGDTVINGIMNNDIVEITFNYKLKEASVFIKYIDAEAGNLIADTETIKGHMFDTYTTTSKEITGYVLSKVPENAYGKINDEVIYVIYEYIEQQIEEEGVLIIRHVDEDGNELIQSSTIKYNIGDEYMTTSEDIDGYELLKTPENRNGIIDSSSIVVTYVYNKVEKEKPTSQVLIQYLDTDGNSIHSSTVITGFIGDIYQTEPLNINGYELVYDSGNANGEINEFSTIVMYIYQKIVVQIPDDIIGKQYIINNIPNNVTSIQLYNYNAYPITYMGHTYNTGNLIAILPVNNTIATTAELPNGVYRWKEYKTSTGFSKNKNYYLFEVSDEINDPVVIENGKIKISDINGTSLSGMEFELKNVGETVKYNQNLINKDEVLLTFTGYSNSFTIEDLPYGTYELKQIKTPNNAYIDATIYNISITNDDLVEIYICIPSHQHNWDNGEIVLKPTCTNYGEKVFKCNICGEEIYEKIDLLEHEIYEKSPTISEDGYRKCHNCDFEQILPKLEYSEDEEFNHIELEEDTFVYTGSMIRPSVKVFDTNGKIIPKSKYSVSYSNNINVGTATVKIVFRDANIDIMYKTFSIIPKHANILSIVPIDNGFTVKWEKNIIETEGYEIEYATQEDFSDAQKVIINKNTIMAKNLYGLKDKTMYFVRIRTFNDVYFSEWSYIKSVTTK